ncbi:hypothetical protein [Cypionkella sp. TWP1-2-1b2]|uniref:hypothetical protein n=1 Tax=Cypionkella sp. TWP1-2-1b2 TaxID=2804675 RepID=UPI003CE72B39
MRFCMVLAVVVAGCTLGGGKLAKPSDSANPITGDAIAVTSLDAPTVAGAADPAKPAAEIAKPDPAAQAVAPQPNPAAVDPAKATSPPVAEEPARVLGPEELACVKKGGQWSVAGKAGGMSCVRRMRDAGKSCHKESDCEGDCLARSNTCAPIAPLFGCNEILQDNGAMVTLCID